MNLLIEYFQQDHQYNKQRQAIHESKPEVVEETEAENLQERREIFEIQDQSGDVRQRPETGCVQVQTEAT